MSSSPVFDMPIPVPRVEPTPRWIRVRAGETWLADSRRASLLAWYGPGMLPTYCFPADDVRVDLLRETGDGWHDAELSRGVLPRAARLLDDVPEPAGAANGLWTFTWDGSVRWFEEALEIQTHARDPSKRVDVVPSERLIRVELDGTLLADSRSPAALFETTLPTRWYLPPQDVALDLLEPSELRTTCPYKRRAASVASCIEMSPGGIRSRCPNAPAFATESPSSTNASTSRSTESDGGHGNLPVGGHRISPLADAGSPRPWPSVLPTVLS